ncbi:MAG: biopolymer transporter TolR, partial [Bacteroidota bacterium]
MKYSMYTLLIFIFMVFSNQQIYSQPQYLGQYGVFESHTDIGNPGIPGSVQYNEGDQSYLITGSGENMWFDTDEFYFVWKRLSGDFLVRADMEFVGEGNHAH